MVFPNNNTVNWEEYLMNLRIRSWLRDSYSQFADSQFTENSWSQKSWIERIYCKYNLDMVFYFWLNPYWPVIKVLFVEKCANYKAHLFDLSKRVHPFHTDQTFTVFCAKSFSFITNNNVEKEQSKVTWSRQHSDLAIRNIVWI